jgi:CBS domain containing-hemolysin-like protein
MDTGQTIALLGLVGATIVLAAVAAAETALERASEVRIQALAARRHPKALRIASKVTEPRAFLAPLTLARVISAAAVVALAAYIGAVEFGPLDGAIGIGMAASAYVAVIQLTVGLVAAREPEYAALQLGQVARLASAVFAIPAVVLGLPARLLARSIRVVTVDADDDLLALVEQQEAAGGVAEQESRMIRGVIAMESKSAREIMVPRIDVVAADVESSLEDVATLITARGFSRIPVYRDRIDEVVGIVYAKDLLRALSDGSKVRRLSELMRQPLFIPESKRLDELLTEMRARRTHMAVVVDEYGGTAGILTIEDLLEEIVGEIEDEYDVAASMTERISDDEAIVDGRASTDVLDELFDYKVESDEFDTIGGFLMHRLGRMPIVGDAVEVDGLRLEIATMSGRRVQRLRVKRESAGSGSAPGPAADMATEEPARVAS